MTSLPPLPKKPKSIHYDQVIRYVRETLANEYPDYTFRNVSKKGSYTINGKIFSDIEFTADANSFGDFEIVVAVSDKLSMSDRVTAKDSVIRDLNSKLFVLSNISARSKLLIITNRSTFYALETHLKSLKKSLSIPTPLNFILNDENIEVKLVEFPVFVPTNFPINQSETNETQEFNKIQPKINNQSFTFSQILGGLRHGLFSLKSLPLSGYLAAPLNGKSSDEQVIEEKNQERTPWNDKNGHVIRVNVREIVAYLYSRSGLLDNNPVSTKNNSRKRGTSPSASSQAYAKYQESKSQSEPKVKLPA